MITKRIVFLIIGMCIFQSSYSQKAKIYLNDEFAETTKDSATYYRIIKSHPEGAPKLFVQTFFINGNLMSNAGCYDNQCLQKEGHYLSFYENGNKNEEGYYVKTLKTGNWKEWFENGQLKESGNYEQGSQKGSWSKWYSNGQLMEEGEYIGDWNTEAHLRYKLKNYWDDSGNQLITSGSGKMTYYHDDTLAVSSIGLYKNGFKNGTWKGFNIDGTVKYEETYSKSKVKGISYDEEGKKYKYYILEEQPSPDGGMYEFYNFVMRKLKYPAKARRHGIQGKVFVQFEVDEAGQLINIQTVKGIGGGCDEEAERVVKMAPKWKPGTQRGQPVKVRMILPLTFKLG